MKITFKSTYDISYMLDHVLSQIPCVAPECSKTCTKEGSGVLFVSSPMLNSIQVFRSGKSESENISAYLNNSKY